MNVNMELKAASRSYQLIGSVVPHHVPEFLAWSFHKAFGAWHDAANIMGYGLASTN